MKFLYSVLLFLTTIFQGYCQIEPVRKMSVKKGSLVKLRDTTFITKNDTMFLLLQHEAGAIKITENPFTKSTRFYDSLEERSKKSKTGNKIFGLVVRKKDRKEKLLTAIVKSEDVFKPFEGLVISSIVFKAVDLLEGSVIDTLQKASSRFGIFVNKLHRDTRSFIIERNLFFNVGDRVDPYQLADNERILRQFVTLRDARIYLSPNIDNEGEVDVVVVTQDVGSIGASGSFSSFNKFRIDIYDVNILGLARQLQLSYFQSGAYAPKNGIEVRLRDPNFLGTFMQGQLQYTNNYLRHQSLITLGRDFFTPEIKYAGGIELYRTHEKFYFEEYDTLQLPYTENSMDFWAGRSFQFAKRNNLIVAARTNTQQFVDVPFISQDSNAFFFDRTLFLGSISITQRNYLRTLRIRGFGKTEDLPIGGSVSVIGGREANVFTDRTYLELDVTFGKYFQNFGYLNLAFASGSFFRNRTASDGLLSATGTYFTDLIKVRRLQLRQFVFISYMSGINRVLDQTISIPGKWRFDDRAPLGNQRMTIGLESVYFMPWYVYGFQFALFYRFDLYLLSQDNRLLSRHTSFPVIRAGVRTQNENLVLPRLSLELAYYGRNQNYRSAWEVKFTTSLINLFTTTQVFKPQVSVFN
jgi:hypothetical protein